MSDKSTSMTNSIDIHEHAVLCTEKNVFDNKQVAKDEKLV